MKNEHFWSRIFFSIFKSYPLGNRHRRLTGEILERRNVLSGLVGVTGPSTVDEGEYAYFDFENNDPFSDDVTVFYRTVGGTAIQDTDYEGVDTSITFSGSVSVGVLVFDDIVRDPGKTFSLEIVSVINGGIDSEHSSVEVSINDLPVEYVASITAVDDEADEAGQNTATVRISLNRPALTDVTIPIEAFVPVLELNGFERDEKFIAESNDYQALPSSVTIPQGEDGIDLVITPVDDTTVEANERVDIAIFPEDIPETEPYRVSWDIWHANVTIYDNEWRFVEPEFERLEEINGQTSPILHDVIWDSYWYSCFPSGTCDVLAHAYWSAPERHQVKGYSYGHDAAGSWIDMAAQNATLTFEIHPQTGDVVKGSPFEVVGTSHEGTMHANVGYSVQVADFGPNEKRVEVTLEQAVARNYEINSSVGIPLPFGSISLSFGADLFGTSKKWGVTSTTISLVARNRVDDGNDGVD